jgi:PAS domain-containing protein
VRGETLTGMSAPDVRLRMPDGPEFELNVSGAPVRDGEGRIVASVSICRDVTERRRLERRTNEALAALLKMAEALVLDPGEIDASAECEGADEQASRAMVKRIAQRLAEVTCSVLGCSRVGILAIEPETELQRPLAVAGLAPELERQWWAEQEQQEVHLGDGPDQAAVARLRAGETLSFDMTRPPYDQYANPYGIRTVLLAPMRIGDQVVGLLSLDYGGAEHEYTPAELSLAGAVARLAALVIERERLVDARAVAQASELALREANRRMDEFLSMVSHELKNPLASVKMTTQVAVRRLGAVAREMAGQPTALAGVERVRGTLARADSQVVRG